MQDSGEETGLLARSSAFFGRTTDRARRDPPPLPNVHTSLQRLEFRQEVAFVFSHKNPIHEFVLHAPEQMENKAPLSVIVYEMIASQFCCTTQEAEVFIQLDAPMSHSLRTESFGPNGSMTYGFPTGPFSGPIRTNLFCMPVPQLVNEMIAFIGFMGRYPTALAMLDECEFDENDCLVRCPDESPLLHEFVRARKTIDGKSRDSLIIVCQNMHNKLSEIRKHFFLCGRTGGRFHLAPRWQEVVDDDMPIRCRVTFECRAVRVDTTFFK